MGDGKPLATGGQIEIAFDRLLDPQTVVRQAFPVRDATGNVVASPVIKYDPITRVVTIVPDPGALADDQFYTVTVGIPKNDDDNGLRAIDRATLDPSSGAAGRTISFFACNVTGSKCAPDAGAPVAPAVVPVASFCNDIFPIFESQRSKIAKDQDYRGHCSGAQCHAVALVDGPSEARHLPAAGLVLQSPDGITATAIDKPAQGSMMASKADDTLPATRLFGVNMPVIHTHAPATSWLLYKLLLAVPPDPATVPQARRKECYPNSDAPAPQSFPLPAAPFQPLTDAERRVLSDYVLGREMPYPSHPGLDPDPGNDNFPLTFDEMQRLRVWIEQGAPVDPKCGGTSPSCYGTRDDEPLLCRPGFADCNAIRATDNTHKLDGCEVNLLCDALNCGSCGKACATTEACVHGTCGAPIDGGACAPSPADAGRD